MQSTNYNLNDLEISSNYASSYHNLLEAFYKPCIEKSLQYDRSTGSFSTAIISLLQKPIAQFAKRGGKIRLVCSHELTDKDIVLIDQGYEMRNIIAEKLIEDIDIASSDPSGAGAINFISSLIALESLDIRIAFTPGSKGIFHEKKGIFRDELDNMVTFVGSANESYMAWTQYGNHEIIEVFTSWGKDNDRTDRHLKEFERLWKNEEPNLAVLPFPEVAKDKLRVIEASLDPVKAYEDYEKTVNYDDPDQDINHKGPERHPALGHQLTALQAWKDNEYRGILKHATGSGKTYTALMAIEEWINNERGPCIILVPSLLLLDQWQMEFSRFFRGKLSAPVVFGSGHSSDWKRPKVLTSLTNTHSNSVIISTIHTARRQNFLKQVQEGPHLLLVWDEVHWAGADENSNIFDLNAGGRLGLSATPERYGHDEGTKKIMDYFGGVVHEFTLKDAMDSKRLCPYNYYVGKVSLRANELEEWQDLTKRIKKAYARLPKDLSGKLRTTPQLDTLKFQRSKIIKKADQKITAGLEIIKKNYKPGDSWIIYCEDKDQLDILYQELQNEGFDCDSYFSYMESDKNQTIDKFKLTGGILVAIRCLDEGVDIPSITHGLILASSQNPREFIQRRGRLLRLHPGKHLVYIHDMIVLPPNLESEENVEFLSVAENEIARAVTFSENSSNISEYHLLRNMARDIGIMDFDLTSTSNSQETTYKNEEY
jgi:superfamily II DNA or RNA helicase